MSPQTQRIVKSLVRTIAPNVLSLAVLGLAHFGLQWTPDAQALVVTQQLLAYAIFGLIRWLEERGHKRAGYLLGWAGPPRYEQAPPVSSGGSRGSGQRIPRDWPDKFARLARAEPRTAIFTRSRVSAGAVTAPAVLAAVLAISPAQQPQHYVDGVSAGRPATVATAGEIYGVSWHKPTIGVYDATGGRWPVRAAARDWSRAGSYRLQLVDAPCSGCITVTNGATELPEWVGQADRSVLGSEIVDCDVVMSSSWDLRLLSRAYDGMRAAAVDHELGHCLGLAHETATVDAVMYPSVGTGSPTDPTAYDVSNLRLVEALSGLF